ncbi:emp24/gp25L/p24 family/GOLD [Carpediemonas membranifera]|uniref:Emp24/gp25L/p24 family/GOLD n=1 Tax=Carpediemonas membranifera TaxID=201153 RepID=A0A8J6E379_9EUKA|nr:emp24/gp25L/p24 family/GOLD [Carpediemonas membranifera]|eukprot:KAG9395588.1 emp24/gp25L/p24 family/GOLD [Carpediemonas membranifera]
MKLSAIVLILCVTAYVSALSFEVGANRMECFFEDYEIGQVVSGSWHVLSGGTLDMDMKITTPSEFTKYDNRGDNTGSFNFVADEAGTYRFCFINTMHNTANKLVIFNIEQKKAKKAAATRDDLTPLEDSIVRLSETLSAVQSEQRYLRQREKRHRIITDSTNRRILLWSMIQTFALLLTAAWQVFYIRKFFSRSRKTSI